MLGAVQLLGEKLHPRGSWLQGRGLDGVQAMLGRNCGSVTRTEWLGGGTAMFQCEGLAGVGGRGRTWS